MCVADGWRWRRGEERRGEESKEKEEEEEEATRVGSDSAVPQKAARPRLADVHHYTHGAHTYHLHMASLHASIAIAIAISHRVLPRETESGTRRTRRVTGHVASASVRALAGQDAYQWGQRVRTPPSADCTLLPDCTLLYCSTGWIPSFGQSHPYESSTSPDWIPVSCDMRWMNPGPAVCPLPISTLLVSVADVWYVTLRTGVMTAAVPAAATSSNLPACTAVRTTTNAHSRARQLETCNNSVR